MDQGFAKAVTRVKKNPYKLVRGQSSNSLSIEKQKSAGIKYFNDDGSPILEPNNHLKINLKYFKYTE